ncbi:MAG: ribonuclease Z [Acidobacteria bacterium]|nr:ribonuclease Z [Acidobacteriota bacterium]MBV9477908.1 ribonuclease Z [Acidobacteriota bacterium]
MRIVLLGTSSGTPTRTRNVSSLAMILDGRVLLFDCGEGTQHQLLRAPVRTGAIEAIFVSHLHGDHVYGLPGLLATLSMNGRTRPLDLVGPESLRAYVETTLATSFHHPSFEIRITTPPYRGHGFTVTAAPLEHSVECLGYCVIEDDRPGHFDVARARALGIPPGPLYGELARAGDPRVCGPPRRGRRIAFVTDTRPCASAVALAHEADALIHESTYGEELRTEAAERFHSTAREAARVASDARVQRLILTHFSARYGDVAPLVEEAREVFPNTIAADDLLEVHVAAR